MAFAKCEISVEMHSAAWNMELTFTFYIHLSIIHSNTIYNITASSQSNNNTVESFLFFLPLSKEELHLYLLFPVVQIIFTYIIAD